MSTPDRSYVITGKVGGAYGIKGWLKILSFTEEVAQILQYKPWYLSEGSGWQAYEVEDGRIHGNGIVVKFAGFDTPEDARKLTGREIAIPRDQLAPLPENEFYWADLVGLTVIDQHGKILGTIKHMLETGSNDVFVIKDPNGRDWAIPYLPGSVVKKVDLAAGQIFVEWDLI